MRVVMGINGAKLFFQFALTHWIFASCTIQICSVPPEYNELKKGKPNYKEKYADVCNGAMGIIISAVAIYHVIGAQVPLILDFFAFEESKQTGCHAGIQSERNQKNQSNELRL